MNRFMRIFFILLLMPCFLCGYETIVESDAAHYNGQFITLTGNVRVENAIGVVTADVAVLKKDEAHTTKIDFPWIELKQNVRLTLAEGGILKCDSLVFDYTQKTSFFRGNPQVTYSDGRGEIFANWAQIDYREVEGSLEATKISLYENVQLTHLGSNEKPASQYALADEVYYLPQEHLTVLEGKKNRVLFYDKLRDMQLSARTVYARQDPVTKKQTVQGLGDVRFVFGPEEFEKIKYRFQK